MKGEEPKGKGANISEKLHKKRQTNPLNIGDSATLWVTRDVI